MLFLQSGTKGLSTLAVATAALCAIGIFAIRSSTAAQDAPDAARSDELSAAKLKKRSVVRKTNAKSAEAVAAASPITAPKQDEHPASIDFMAQLAKAGATSCRSQVNALAASTMGSAVKFNTVSNWSEVAGDKRAVSLAIGQKYPDGSAVPFGVSQVISTPNQQGTCDGFVVQVLPSPLSCGKLRDTISAAHGQQIGDLAGISLMRDGGGNTMLLPTVTNTCVLVATRSVYAR